MNWNTTFLDLVNSVVFEDHGAIGANVKAQSLCSALNEVGDLIDAVRFKKVLKEEIVCSARKWTGLDTVVDTLCRLLGPSCGAIFVF